MFRFKLCVATLVVGVLAGSAQAAVIGLWTFEEYAGEAIFSINGFVEHPPLKRRTHNVPRRPIDKLPIAPESPHAADDMRGAASTLDSKHPSNSLRYTGKEGVACHRHGPVHGDTLSRFCPQQKSKSPITDPDEVSRNVEPDSFQNSDGLPSCSI